ncbi:MAG TPA: SMP-30/gluconolactonase/LRE family protein [Gaiellaceae bacterium]|nr:SMP-30/gluconolactonase/LRE family protein [Gaiellaceae bacterium]
MSAIETLVDGLDHPEGVCWDPRAGVVWAGGEAGQVYRVQLEERTAEEEARAPGFVLGLAVDGRGRIVLCCGYEGSLCVLEDGSVRTVENSLRFPNSAAFGPDGTLYFSDSGSWRADDGRVFRLSADGELEVFSTALTHYPNGCAVSADGRHLWIVESRRPTVNRFDLRTGELEEVTRLEGTVPDGIAFTAEGEVLVACYRPDRIVLVDSAGSCEIVAEDPQGTLLAAPTNIAFAGPELDRLVCANLGRWHLALVECGLRGAPLHYPTRWAVDA